MKRRSVLLGAAAARAPPAPARSRRRPGRLPEPADPHGRPLAAGAGDGPDRARGGAEGVRADRPAHRPREPRRRRRHDRHGRGGQGGAGRLHRPDGLHRADHHGAAGAAHALRPGTGFRAGRDVRRQRLRAGGDQQIPGARHGGVRGAAARRAGQVHLRHLRRRRGGAPHHLDDPEPAQGGHRACALPGQRPGAHRRGRRAGGFRGGHPGRDRAAGAAGRAAGARRLAQGRQRAGAGNSAAGAAAGPGGLRCRRLGRLPVAERARRRRSSSGWRRSAPRPRRRRR